MFIVSLPARHSGKERGADVPSIVLTAKPHTLASNLEDDYLLLCSMADDLSVAKPVLFGGKSRHILVMQWPRMRDEGLFEITLVMSANWEIHLLN